MKQIVVVGAGASGLMASIAAAEHGASVTILEQNEKPGKKLSATGNGRGNLTNLSIHPEDYRGTHPEFVRSAMAQFSVEDTLTFFKDIGAAPVSRDGYIYPRCNQAAALTALLQLKARSLGVKIKTQEKVFEIKREDPWVVKTQSWQYPCDAVILANGSKASAIAGSDGSGYELAQKLGHSVITPFPALCALHLKGDRNLFSRWAGIRTQGSVTVNIEGGPQFLRQSGELQLTDYGISGIPVFQVSRYAIHALNEKKNVSLSIDFLPEIADENLMNYFAKRKEAAPYLKDSELLCGLLSEKLAKVLSDQKLQKKSSDGSRDTQERLLSSLKHLTFPVSRGMDFMQAQVCGGGVDTKEVEETTMESRLQPGIYFAGELLDIDGTCGGYNLQWAWSSGHTAGVHAADEA